VFIWLGIASCAVLLACLPSLLHLQAFDIYCNLEMINVLSNYVLLNQAGMLQLLAARISMTGYCIACSKLL
jgi:hypothetical protein